MNIKDDGNMLRTMQCDSIQVLPLWTIQIARACNGFNACDGICSIKVLFRGACHFDVETQA